GDEPRVVAHAAGHHQPAGQQCPLRHRRRRARRAHRSDRVFEALDHELGLGSGAGRRGGRRRLTLSSTASSGPASRCLRGSGVWSLKVGLMSDAFNNRAWMAAADAPEDEEDDDDFDELLELFEELLVLFDEDDDDDDGLELDVAATLFFLPSSRVSRNAAMAT